MPEPLAPEAPAAAYRARAAAHREAGDAAGVRARWLERARLGLFVVGALAAIATRDELPLAVAIGAVALVALAGVAVVHRRVAREARWHGRLADACARGEARVLRQWDRLPAPAVRVPDDHPYAADLAVTGRASLWQLVDTVSAYPGRDVLAAWLLDAPASATEIAARQDAARALAPAVEWREALAAHAFESGSVRRVGVDAFVEWAGGAPGALANGAAYAAACIPTAALLAAATWTAASPASWPAASRVAGLAVAANVVLTLVVRRRAAATLTAASQWSRGLRQHAALLAHAAEPPARTPLLTRHADALHAGGGAARAAARLERVAMCGEVRYSPMMYAFAQALLLWDAHVAAGVERWRRDAGSQVRAWFAALGAIESLAALGTLAHDNPSWTFPTLGDDARPAFDADALAHPLIAGSERVPNDVQLGPPGAVLLVTGSNMSGKSTLLRAIGLNAVLAQAGAPVCAARLVTSRLRVMTSVVVHDALAEHTSLFLAELKRVKGIVDAARGAEAGAAPVLYLLDEVLHGTNSAERRVATRAVLSHLLDARALGAVSTHDLALAADEPLASRARLVHFTESVHDAPGGGARMTFDYRLRPGLATSTNALVLLRLMGLDAD